MSLAANSGSFESLNWRTRCGFFVQQILIAERLGQELDRSSPFIALTDIGMSPYPVMKVIGSWTMIMVTSSDISEQKRAEEALRQSEAQWREVFEHNPLMYFMVSATGTLLLVNGFGAEQLGYTADELIGHSIMTVFLEEDWETVKDQLATCAEELGRSHYWEIRNIRKDGKVIWVRENAKAVQRSGNDVIVLIACEDITERRRGEQRVAAQYAVTRILAEADSLAGVASPVLRAIGENLEWDWGCLWSFDWERDRDGTPLRCDVLWRASDIETSEFDTVSREWIFADGEGLVGQVWRTAEPVWMVDATTQAGFLRASAAAKAGLHGAVIFRSCSIPNPSGSLTCAAAQLASATKSSSPHCRRSAASSASSSSGGALKRRCAQARNAGVSSSTHRPQAWPWPGLMASLPQRTLRYNECSAAPTKRSSGTASLNSTLRKSVQQPRRR